VSRTDLFQLFAGDSVCLRHVESLERPHPLRGLPPEKEVSGYTRQRNHRQVLVDSGYPAVYGVSWRVEENLLAVDQQRALCRLVDPGEGLDQGGLARPVVPKQAHNLSGADIHGDVFEGNDVPEVL
jgi:hypothetical protein